MFENLSLRSMILLGTTAILAVGAVVSAVVDCRQTDAALEECCCECEACDCDVADPTAAI